MDWLRPLLLMFYAPARGMAEVRDRAPLGQAALLAVLLQAAQVLLAHWRELAGVAAGSGPWAAVRVLLSSAGSVLLVALVYVPLSVLVANLFERRGSFGLVLRQEYGAAASTTLYALAAASLLALPLAYLDQAAGLGASVERSAASLSELMRQTSPQGATEEEAAAIMAAATAALPRALLLIIIQPIILFSLWAVAAVREVFRLTWGKAVVSVVVSTVLMIPALLLLPIFSALLGSPFLVLLIFFVLRSYFAEEAATLNPADASAHYNLGLLHQQRKEYEEARTRFLRAVEIDPEETDAHYQLGRIARAEGRLSEAITHFGEAVSRDDSHAQHEVWREVGATYLAAGQFNDARDALERFLARRPSDPEALYLMGRAAAGLGDPRGAREWMQRCVEAVRTAPAYKYRADKRWLNEAQQFLRTQA
jgi:tetratricopeptide (TPR) repeat protein